MSRTLTDEFRNYLNELGIPCAAGLMMMNRESAFLTRRSGLVMQERLVW